MISKEKGLPASLFIRLPHWSFLPGVFISNLFGLPPVEPIHFAPSIVIVGEKLNPASNDFQ